MVRLAVVISAFVVLADAIPAPEPVLRKLDAIRYHYVKGPDGTPHLVDLRMTSNDIAEAMRFDPDRQNAYHLFTRENPSQSQPLINGNLNLLQLTNFNVQRRTVVIVHGWLDDASADLNTVLVPAFLQADDMNVIVVDWSAGAGTINYFTAASNIVPSGESIARFINWLSTAGGASVSSFHLVGYSLGAHQVGVIGRNLGGEVPYITALDPPLLGFVSSNGTFRSTDGIYTEVLHTSALGYIPTLGDVDFYPNGGRNMPGCNSQNCDHMRSFFYLAESVVYGGFLGQECASYVDAMTGNCTLPGSLRMGGLHPKTGSSGIYWLETNAAPPFSRE